MRLKDFLVGVIVGAFAFTAIPSIATQIDSVVANPYKITVNDEIKDIKGYNIDGSSYFNLRDIGDAVGFTVGFKEDTIIIKTDNTNKEASVDGATDAIAETGNNLPYWDYYKGSDFEYIYHDSLGNIWYNIVYADSLLPKGYSLDFYTSDDKPNINSVFTITLSKNGEEIMSGVSMKLVDDAIPIVSKECFESVILPLCK